MDYETISKQSRLLIITIVWLTLICNLCPMGCMYTHFGYFESITNLFVLFYETTAYKL